MKYSNQKPRYSYFHIYLSKYIFFTSLDQILMVKHCHEISMLSIRLINSYFTQYTWMSNMCTYVYTMYMHYILFTQDILETLLGNLQIRS